MDRRIIEEAKELINANDVAGFRGLLQRLQSADWDGAGADWATLFHRVYLHACLKKRTDIVAILNGTYEGLDPLMKLGLRQIFPYGRWLLSR